MEAFLPVPQLRAHRHERCRFAGRLAELRFPLSSFQNQSHRMDAQPGVHQS
ncbi:MAG: hypothetical protein ACXWQ5_05910 [Ktedonobacterales bacterium]